MRLYGASVMVVLLAMSGVARAHSVHAAVAEAELNRETGRLEVALRVCPDDFHQALRRFYRERADVSKVASLDDLIRQYLGETFAVRSASGARRELVWVGKEMNAEEVWLYFEVPLPGGLGGARLAFDVLAGEFPDQVNTLDLRDGRTRRVLSFGGRRGERELAPAPRNAEPARPPRSVSPSPVRLEKKRAPHPPPAR